MKLPCPYLATRTGCSQVKQKVGARNLFSYIYGNAMAFAHKLKTD